MPNFHKDNRVYTDSLIQIAEGINDLVLRLAKGKIRFGKKRKVNKARFLNALYLWILSQHDSVQDEIIGGIMPLLYKHHEAKERIEIELVPPTVGRKRVSHPTGHRIIKDSTVGENCIATEDDIPGRRR